MIIFAEQNLARGLHDIQFIFPGSYSHIGTDEAVVGYVWADLLVSIDANSTSSGIRSDGTFGPITISGSISEVGGMGEIFENLLIKYIIE